MFPSKGLIYSSLWQKIDLVYDNYICFRLLKLTIVYVFFWIQQIYFIDKSISGNPQNHLNIRVNHIKRQMNHVNLKFANFQHMSAWHQLTTRVNFQLT